MATSRLKRVAVYFGFRAEEDAERMSTALTLLRGSLLSTVTPLTVLSGLMATAMIGIFARDPTEVMIGTAVGAALFGPIVYFVWVRPRIPRGPLQTVPPDAHWERTRRPMRLVCGLVLAVPFCIGVAWLAERLDVGSAIVSGQFAGYAVAPLVGAWQVARWERRHGVRVACRFDRGDERLFALPPSSSLSQSSRRTRS